MPLVNKSLNSHITDGMQKLNVKNNLTEPQGSTIGHTEKEM